MTQPMKLCECGCGEAAPIATGTDATRGYVKGKPRRFINGHQMRAREGARNNRYNSGLHIPPDGRAIVCGRDGSLSPFARVLMEAHVSRELTSNEVVHHVNGDRSDDRIENLQVLTRAEHLALHRPEVDAGIRMKVRRGSAHHRSKLTETDVRAIRLRVTEGHGDAAIAEVFGVGRGTIHSVRTGRTWSHVP